MTRPPLPREEYVQVGKAKGLTFLPASVPPSVHHKTDWRCEFCGTTHKKTYRAVKYSGNGCTCQNKVTLSQDSYHQLAARLGIRWIGKVKPRNTKTATEWMGPGNVKVSATYRQLAYGLIREDLAKLLGVAPDVGLHDSQVQKSP